MEYRLRCAISSESVTSSVSKSQRAWKLPDGFHHLQEHVAITAFDIADTEGVSSCYPETRKAVLNNIYQWIMVQAVTRIQWVLWLNGAAGAGKSAIARSTVQFCIDNDIPIVRFFFARSDSARTNNTSLVATLVVQLLKLIPELCDIIIPALEADPLIFQTSLETQLRSLIFEPLRDLKARLYTPKTLVLLFDGVDEYDRGYEQAKLIRDICDFVRTV